MTRMRVFVPPERVVHTVGLLNEWLHKQFAKEREIMSLAGQLSFISRVIRWGRPYIADLFALARKSSSTAPGTSAFPPHSEAASNGG